MANASEGEDVAFLRFLAWIGMTEDMADSWAEFWWRTHENDTEPLPELVPIDEGPVPAEDCSVLVPADNGIIAVVDADDILMVNEDDPEAKTLGW